MNDCPSADDIATFLEGGASGEVAKQVLSHVDHCVPCRLMIASALQSQGAAKPSTATAGRVKTFGDGELVNERYRIARFISRGGMGEVYEARDTHLHETVALKTIVCTGLDNAKLLAQLRAEVQIARKIIHPNVCRLLEFGIYCRESQGAKEQIPFFTMDLLVGETLGQLRVRCTRLTESQLLPLALQIVDGLIAVHDAGIVHRDLKPDNVFIVSADSGKRRAVLMDFGLARSLTKANSLVSSTGMTAVGTPAYMAPEQVAGGAPSVSWDIYAVGVILFEMLAGRLPFQRESALAIAVAKINTAAPPLSSIHPVVDTRFERIVAKCLERKPLRRFANMLELRDALQGLREADTAHRRRFALSSRRMVVTAAACGAALALGATLAGRATTSNSVKPSTQDTSTYRPGGTAAVPATSAVVAAVNRKPVNRSSAAEAQQSADDRAAKEAPQAADDRAAKPMPRSISPVVAKRSPSNPNFSTVVTRPRERPQTTLEPVPGPSVQPATASLAEPRVAASSADDALALPRFVKQRPITSPGSEP